MDIISLVTTSYYDYPSNFSNGTAVNGLGTLFTYIDNTLGNTFGIGLIFTIAIIGFLTLKGSGYTSSKSFTAVTFVTLLLSILLMMVGILDVYVPMIIGIAAIVMGLITRHESNQGL